MFIKNSLNFFRKLLLYLFSNFVEYSFLYDYFEFATKQILEIRKM